MIAPNKATIYGDRFYREEHRRKNPDCMTKAKQVVHLLRKEGVTVLYPVEKLLEWEKEFNMPMYCKKDTHWAPATGTLVFGEILKIIDPSAADSMIVMNSKRLKIILRLAIY